MLSGMHRISLSPLAAATKASDAGSYVITAAGLTSKNYEITATPGTLWLQYDRSRSILLLHVLDMVDDQQWIDLIKNRYERLLMEIFE